MRRRTFIDHGQPVGGAPFRPGMASFETDRHLGGDCRVCGGKIAAYELALIRPWGTGEKAHVACGWLRPEEREPHETRIPERFGTYFEWACSSCGRDVIASKQKDDLRCISCRGPDVAKASETAPPRRKAGAQ